MPIYYMVEFQVIILFNLDFMTTYMVNYGKSGKIPYFLQLLRNNFLQYEYIT